MTNIYNMNNINESDIIMDNNFDTSAYERIKLNYDEVKKAIYDCPNQKDMAIQLGCGTDKLRKFLNENGLYKEYCDEHHIPYKPQALLPCEICGEIKNTHTLHGKTYCKRHYNQMYRYNKISECTIYDKNEYTFDGNIVYIIIKDKNQNYKCESIIDAEDYYKICQYKWYESYGYCVTKGVDPNNGIDISNVIFNNFDVQYDHQNHNRLDNTKANLRPVSSHENAMNMGKKNTNTSGVTGVQRQNKKSKRWTASITYNYKSIWLGSDVNFDQVVIKRLRGEAKYFKEYSANYDRNKQLICLEYISKSDGFVHYIEIDLDGNIITNNINPDQIGEHTNAS